jgi:glycosyltransferase involved in cell wall biosynthesis
VKRILLITTGFAPQNRIGAVRTTKIAKYLVKKGYQVTVITNEVNNNEKLDKTLISSELDKMSIYRVSKGVIFNKLFLSIRNKLLRDKSASTYKVNNKSTFIARIKTFIMSRGIEMYLLTERLFWEYGVKKLIKKSLRGKSFDVVISSYPKTSAHNIALYLLKKQKVNTWIADFRDPLAYQSLNSKKEYKRNEKVQKHFCVNASAVTYVTEEMLNKLSKDIQDEEKFYYLPNGYDEDDLKSIEGSGMNLEEEFKNIFRITYVGSLYGGKRDISVVFKILRDLRENKRIDINKVKFFYAGKDYETLKKQAQNYNLQDILVNMGYVTREDSLKIQQQSNLIIVNTWNTKNDQGVIPGKVYECFLLKKPTLAITNGTVPNSELGKMVVKAGLGLSYETMIQNPKYNGELMKYVESLYKSTFDNMEYNLLINKDYIEQFNYESIVERLISIFESIPCSK